MARPKQGNVRINVLIQPQVLNALKRIAKIRGTTYSELMRQACASFVREEVARIRAKQAEQHNNHDHNEQDAA